MAWLRLVATGLFCAGAGCVIDVGSPLTDGEDPPDDSARPPAGDAGVADVGSPGVIDEPLHGQVIAGPTASTVVRVHGFHREPARDLSVQVLDVPADLDGWIEIATARTSDDALAGAAEPMYAWQVDVAPALAAPSRWPQGGVLRLRVIDPEDGAALVALPHDAPGCVDDHLAGGWSDIATACAAPVNVGLVLVNPPPAAASEGPRFLDLKGTATTDETDAYYAAIGAPATLDDFRAAFGFGGAGEASAVYYNAGDLGIGREMHCTPFDAAAGQGLACYVANYGSFGGAVSVALGDAIDGAKSGTHAGSFATVAMVYRPPSDAPDAVQFMIYGAAGALVNRAALDTHEDNVSVPSNCLNCHGGAATYDPATHSVTGARFLPFDPGGFQTSALPAYSLAAQQPSFRALNLAIRGAGATSGVVELVDGFYAGTTEANQDFVPPGWDGSPDARAVYRHAVAPYCRGCHLSQDEEGAASVLGFREAEAFRIQRDEIGRRMCDGAAPPAERMPSAEAAHRRFWASPARAYLVDFLGLAGPCAPE